MSFSSLLFFSLRFSTISFAIKFEEAKMMFWHGLKAQICSGNLKISSQVFNNTQNPIQVIKISSQLFVALLPWFVAFLCNQLQAWILNKWESIFEKWRRFLLIKYPKTKSSLNFYTEVSVLELQVALWGPCFTISLGHNCWQRFITFWNSTWWISNLA